MNSNFDYDSDKTIIAGCESAGKGEHAIRFFVETDPGRKVLLRSGETVTVGRGPDNDFVVDNQTVSRNHVLIKRIGDNVALDVFGQNGIVFKGSHYTNQVLKCIPPVSFAIGDLLCRIDAEKTEDKTVVVSGGNSVNSAPYDSVCRARPEPEPEPIPPETEEPEIFRSSPAEVSAQDFEPVKSNHSTFEPKPVKMGMAAGRDPKPLFSASKKKIGFLVMGGLVLVAIATVAGYFFFFPQAEKKSPVVPAVTEVRENKVEKKAAQGSHDRYDENALMQAKDFFEKGDYDMARDYLLEIPVDSEFYGEAAKMLNRIPKE